MNTACPSCGTVYAVTPADIGRRIACAKCSLVMAVDATGLRPESPSPSPTPTVTSRLAPLRQYLPELDRPTALFGLGAVLVVAFALMPLIAAAQVERQTSLLNEATLDHTAALRTLRESGADQNKQKDVEDRWQKKRDELQDEARRAEYVRNRSTYWNRYGLLIGAVVLAVGAVGLIRGDYPLTLRIVAGVVLAFQLLLALQTATPLGCAPGSRPYNLGGTTTPAPADALR